eukprot:NODE_1262_length_1405_cov_47.783255_g1251_i0.p1 GENE.NODE_1262_length_1405_cov_47.783255_g1251_i0~~NODE_1262_length_1405_cov_47.783255_g1251_i0.p1  ORF type:complete len:168 (+),score=3.24 NODE_1262_length_1405_cov_47.783255_g1251_i0:770-1273(+)
MSAPTDVCRLLFYRCALCLHPSFRSLHTLHYFCFCLRLGTPEQQLACRGHPVLLFFRCVRVLLSFLRTLHAHTSHTGTSHCTAVHRVQCSCVHNVQLHALFLLCFCQTLLRYHTSFRPLQLSSHCTENNRRCPKDCPCVQHCGSVMLSPSTFSNPVDDVRDGAATAF